LQGEPDLFQIVHALQPPRGFAGRLHGRQKQRDQDRDDGDHHQELDQREPGTAAADAGAVSRLDSRLERREVRAGRL